MLVFIDNWGGGSWRWNISFESWEDFTITAIAFIFQINTVIHWSIVSILMSPFAILILFEKWFGPTEKEKEDRRKATKKEKQDKWENSAVGSHFKKFMPK